MKNIITKPLTFWQLLIAIFIVLSFNMFEKNSQRTVSLAADNMNVLYIGIDNPMTLAVEGISNDQLKIEAENAVLESLGKGKFIAKVSKPGSAIFTVSGKGLPSQIIEYRVKRLPAPVAALEHPEAFSYLMRHGHLSQAILKNANGIMLNLGSCFGLATNLEVAGFKIIRIPKEGAPFEVYNPHGHFSEESKFLLAQASLGDIFRFEEIRARTPYSLNEASWVRLNNLEFKIGD